MASKKEIYSYGKGVADSYNSQMKSVLYGGDSAVHSDQQRSGRKGVPASQGVSLAPFATSDGEDAAHGQPLYDVAKDKPKDHMEPKPGHGGYNPAHYARARVDNALQMEAAKAKHQKGAGGLW